MTKAEKQVLKRVYLEQKEIKVYYRKSNSYRQAEKIEAENLTAAKRMASRRQVFLDTCLKIGWGLDSNGFINEVLAIKEPGKQWKNL